MKIVVVIDIYDLLTNGTVMTAYRFVQELKAKGHTVRVVATGANGEDCFNVRERYIFLATEVARKQQIRFGKPDLITLTTAFEGADVIHFYLPFKLEKQGRKIAKKMDIPHTAAFHLQPENCTYNMGLKWSKLAPKLLYRNFRKRFFKHFTHIHCPSKFIAEQLRKHKYKAKLHVISNGVDRDFVPPAQFKIIEPDQPINIMMIGRFANEKRQDVLIRAISLSKYADRIQLYLAGKGPNQKKLEKLGAKLKNKPVFAFYDKKELINTIHKMDLYVHAADIEIEAIACIEAFSCGVVPIIANSAKSATPQFAIDDRSLFEAGNPKNLAQKIDFLLDNPDQCADLSARYAEQGKKYAIDYSISKAEEMFEEAIAAHNDAKKICKSEKKIIRKKIVMKSWFVKMLSWFFYYFIAAPLMALQMFVFGGLRVKGRRKLKKTKGKGVISVSNHVFLLDCIYVGLGVFPKKILATSDIKSFAMPLSDFALRTIGAIALPTTKKEELVFQEELRRLFKDKKRKRIVHMYPEYKLVNYYAGLRTFDKYPFKLACDLQVPILPITISWRDSKGLYRWLNLKRPLPTITIGDIVEPDYVLLKDEMINDLKERVESSMIADYENSNSAKNFDYWKKIRTDSLNKQDSDNKDK